MAARLALLLLTAALVHCSSNGVPADGGSGDGDGPSDGADDVVHCITIPHDAGLCAVHDSCGNEVGASPDGAPEVVDSCGGQCTCTVDTYGVVTVSCTGGCVCATRCM